MTSQGVQPQLALLEFDQGPAVSPSTRPRIDLHRWARQHTLRLRRRAPVSDELFIYRQAAKLIEEVGELHAELLGHSGLQRTDKGVFSKVTLSEEMADVSICLAILAAATGVDLQQAVAERLQVVEARRQARH